MASSGLHQQLCCPVCEESYDEKNRLPKGFPCQHSVCMSCLHEMIRSCDEAEVECPLCRGRAAIPSDGAAAFPNNLTLLSILDMMQEQVPPSKCPVHPAKRVCGVCVQCWQVVCVLCVQADDHEWDDVDTALDMCIITAQSTLQDIITEYTAITDTIKQKAKRKDFSCFSLLRDLQNIKTEVSSGDLSAHPRLTSSVKKTASLSAHHVSSSADSSDVTPLHSASKLPPDTSSLATNFEPGAVGGILETHNLSIGGQSMNPEAINTDLLQFHSSTKIPDLRFVDINRRNKLLLVFPDNAYAIYDVMNQNRKVKTLNLSCDSVEALELADHVVLSLDNNIVIPTEGAVMYGNTRHSLNDKFHCRILVALEKGFIFSNETSSSVVLQYQEKHLDSVNGSREINRTSGTSVHVMPMNRCETLAVYYHGSIAVCGVKGFADNIEYKEQSESHCTVSVSCASVRERFVLFVVEEGKSIVVKELQQSVNTCRSYNVQTGYCAQLQQQQQQQQHFGGGYLNHVCEYGPLAVKKFEISLQDLGLSKDCKIERIWGGDASVSDDVLHVLYTSCAAKQPEQHPDKKPIQQPPAQYNLASYMVTEKFDYYQKK